MSKKCAHASCDLSVNEDQRYCTVHRFRFKKGLAFAEETPWAQYLEQCREADAMEREARLLREAANEQLRAAQKACPHKNWKSGFMFSECVDCGYNDL